MSSSEIFVSKNICLNLYEIDFVLSKFLSKCPEFDQHQTIWLHEQCKRILIFMASFNPIHGWGMRGIFATIFRYCLI